MADLTPADLERRSRGRPNLKEVAQKQIRDHILSGHLRPGAKIDQDALAETMGISRLPVREALITLEAEGLVDNVARRGSYVARLTPQDILDHFEMFGLVAGLAAERATDLLDESGFEGLNDLIDRMESATDPREQDELNYQFHRTINKAGSSKRLTVVLRLLSTSMPTNFFQFSSEAKAEWAGEAVAEHRLILDALRSGDSARASKALVTHFRNVGEHAVEMLQSTGYWDQSGER